MTALTEAVRRMRHMQISEANYTVFAPAARKAEAEVDRLLAEPAAPAAPSIEMSPDFTDTARAALLWVLWHHQGASSKVGQPIRFALGMGQFDRLNDHQLREAKRWGELPAAPQADAAGDIDALIFKHSRIPIPKQVWFQRNEVEAIVRAVLAHPAPVAEPAAPQAEPSDEEVKTALDKAGVVQHTAAIIGVFRSLRPAPVAEPAASGASHLREALSLADEVASRRNVMLYAQDLAARASNFANELRTALAAAASAKPVAVPISSMPELQAEFAAGLADGSLWVEGSQPVAQGDYPTLPERLLYTGEPIWKGITEWADAKPGGEAHEAARRIDEAIAIISAMRSYLDADRAARSNLQVGGDVPSDQPPRYWVHLDRSYDQRARAIIAFNTCTGDLDDKLDAAWRAAAAPSTGSTKP